MPSCHWHWSDSIAAMRLKRIGPLLLGVAVLLLSVQSRADCAMDLHGEVYCGGGRCLIDRSGKVWCARSRNGDAQKTLNGQVQCGIGQCQKDVKGRIHCSSEVDGAVMRDGRGRIRCYGNCQPASTANCEHTPAASATD